MSKNLARVVGLLQIFCLLENPLAVQAASVYRVAPRPCYADPPARLFEQQALAARELDFYRESGLDAGHLAARQAGRAASVQRQNVDALLPTAEQPKLFHFGGQEKAEGSSGMRSILGNKGANLAEMTNIGLPVPPGFTIPDSETTRIKRIHRVPVQLQREIRRGLSIIEDKVQAETGEPLRFGDPEHLMLLAVRAGAEKSDPGKYLTVNKVGLHRSNLTAYSAQLDNPFQARMDYLKHIQDYFYDVLGRHDDNHGLNYLFLDNKFLADYSVGDYAAMAKKGNLAELDFLVTQMEDKFRQVTDREFPAPKEQLYESIVAVAERYPAETIGKAINLQWQVLGNIADGQSLAGVIFSRNPFNGEKEFVGNYRFAQDGWWIVRPYDSLYEDYSSSSRNEEMHYSELAHTLPHVYSELVRDVTVAEQHYKSIQDMELVVSRGKLYFVQTRDNLPASTPLAQTRALVDMVTEGLLAETEALSRVSSDDLEWLKMYFEQPVVKSSAHKKAIAVGIPLFPGVAQAPLAINPHVQDVADGTIIVWNRPEAMDVIDSSGMEALEGKLSHDVRAILSIKGGYADHTAVTLRRMNKRIPYVILGGQAFVDNQHEIFSNEQESSRLVFQEGEKVLTDGDVVTVDGNTGTIYENLSPDDFEDSEIVRVQNRQLNPEDSKFWPYYQTVLRWIDLKKELVPKTPEVMESQVQFYRALTSPLEAFVGSLQEPIVSLLHALQALAEKRSADVVTPPEKPIRVVLWDGSVLSRRLGIKEVIKALHEAGIVQAIASRDDPEDSLRLRRSLGLDAYMSRHIFPASNKSISVRAACSLWGVQEDEVLLIDDSPDVLEAVKQRTRARTAGYSFSADEREELAVVADHLFAASQPLARVIDQLLLMCRPSETGMLETAQRSAEPPVEQRALSVPEMAARLLENPALAVWGGTLTPEVFVHLFDVLISHSETPRWYSTHGLLDRIGLEAMMNHAGITDAGLRCWIKSIYTFYGDPTDVQQGKQLRQKEFEKQVQKRSPWYRQRLTVLEKIIQSGKQMVDELWLSEIYGKRTKSIDANSLMALGLENWLRLLLNPEMFNAVRRQSGNPLQAAA